MTKNFYELNYGRNHHTNHYKNAHINLRIIQTWLSPIWEAIYKNPAWRIHAPIVLLSRLRKHPRYSPLSAGQPGSQRAFWGRSSRCIAWLPTQMRSPAFGCPMRPYDGSCGIPAAPGTNQTGPGPDCRRHGSQKGPVYSQPDRQPEVQTRISPSFPEAPAWTTHTGSSAEDSEAPDWADLPGKSALKPGQNMYPETACQDPAAGL